MGPEQIPAPNNSLQHINAVRYIYIYTYKTYLYIYIKPTKPNTLIIKNLGKCSEVLDPTLCDPEQESAVQSQLPCL